MEAGDQEVKWVQLAGYPPFGAGAWSVHRTMDADRVATVDFVYREVDITLIIGSPGSRSGRGPVGVRSGSRSGRGPVGVRSGSGRGPRGLL